MVRRNAVSNARNKLPNLLEACRVPGRPTTWFGKDCRAAAAHTIGSPRLGTSTPNSESLFDISPRGALSTENVRIRFHAVRASED